MQKKQSTNFWRKPLLLFTSLLPLLGCKSPALNGDGEWDAAVKIDFVASMGMGVEPTDSVRSYCIRLGDVVTIVGPEQTSIGSSFQVEYDKSAFDVKERSKYDNPWKMKLGARGADRKTRTLWLKAIRPGVFDVVCKGRWRGETTNVERFQFSVEN